MHRRCTTTSKGIQIDQEGYARPCHRYRCTEPDGFGARVKRDPPPGPDFCALNVTRVSPNSIANPDAIYGAYPYSTAENLAHALLSDGEASMVKVESAAQMGRGGGGYFDLVWDPSGGC